MRRIVVKLRAYVIMKSPEIDIRRILRLLRHTSEDLFHRKTELGIQLTGGDELMGMAVHARRHSQEHGLYRARFSRQLIQQD